MDIIVEVEIAVTANMDDSLINDDVDSSSTATDVEESDNDVNERSHKIDQGELLDTSSLTRRLASGEYTKSFVHGIPENEEDEAGTIIRMPSNTISEDNSDLIRSTLSSELNNNIIRTPPPTPLRPNSIATPNRINNNKSALDSLGEYISFFFKNAENYEEMLERNHSQQEHQRIGPPRFSSPENGSSDIDDDDDDVVDLKDDVTDPQQQQDIQHTDFQQQHRVSTPDLMLSDSQEAMAAVEAISNFRSLREVKRQIMDRTPLNSPQKLGCQSSKKLKVSISDNVDEEANVQGWESFCNEKKSNKFDELGVESIPIPVSVDDFYKLVLEDNADHSIEKFMKSIGEMEVESSSWQPSTTGSTNSTTRTIHYIHPINAPMAPPTAAARKEQTLHKFGNIGLCLETCTFVENVPMADCFIVRDRLWVNQNEGSGCIMSITFQIDFIKGTLFRRIIENTTRSEYLKYWSQFWDMIKSNIGSSDSSDELAEVALELEEATSLLEVEGQEVPLTSILGRIRRTSRRLSAVAKRASVRDIVGTAEAEVESSMLVTVTRKGKVAIVEIFTIVRQHLKDHFAEKDDSYVLGCVLILLLGMFNIMAMWQIRAMNKSITLLTNQINEAILTNMGSSENCLNVS